MPAASAMTGIDAFLEHLRVERAMSAHTLDAYRRDLEALREWAAANGAGEPQALDGAALRRFVADEHRRGLSPKSLQRRLSACRSYYAWLLRHGHLAANPAATASHVPITSTLCRTVNPPRAASHPLYSLPAAGGRDCPVRAVWRAFAVAVEPGRLSVIASTPEGEVPLPGRETMEKRLSVSQRYYEYPFVGNGMHPRLPTRCPCSGGSAVIVRRFLASVVGGPLRA